MLPEVACAIDWPGTADFFKDIVVSVAAIFTAGVAYRGISKWRSEEAGKADFDLARRVGKSVFRMRDVLADARRAMTFAYEFPENYDPADGPKQAAAWAHVFNARFEPVRECAIELQSLRNETEALWGGDILVNLNRLVRQATRLQVAMGAYVRNEQALGAHFNGNQGFGDQVRAEVHDMGNAINPDGTEGAPNAMTTEIQSAVDALAAYLRTKLPQPDQRLGWNGWRARR